MKNKILFHFNQISISHNHACKNPVKIHFAMNSCDRDLTGCYSTKEWTGNVKQVGIAALHHHLRQGSNAA